MSDVVLIRATLNEMNRSIPRYVELLNSLSEDELWSTEGGIPNSIGTLTRHLTGNLNHYFGAAILRNGYVRTRDVEFSERGLTKERVIAEFQAALKVFEQTLESLDEKSLSQPFTSPDGDAYETLTQYILHMVMHFHMHYGQADYAQNFMKMRKSV